MARGTRVLVIEDHALLAEMLRLALDHEGYDVEVLDPRDVRSTADVLQQASVFAPAIVLLDLALGRYDGELLVRPLTHAGAAVVVVTASTDRSTWGGCLHEGARAVFAKHWSLSALVETVRTVEAGLPAFTEDEYDELLDLWRADRAETETGRRQLSLLTPREAEVLAELMVGHTIHEIARRSHVTNGTVRKQVSAVLAKLEVTNQVAAVGLAHRVGWQPEHRAIPAPGAADASQTG